MERAFTSQSYRPKKYVKDVICELSPPKPRWVPTEILGFWDSENGGRLIAVVQETKTGGLHDQPLWVKLPPV